MSDGPHRSLNMRAPWKKVAELADKRAFEPEQVRGAAVAAIAIDWRLEVPEAVSDAIREILSPQQNSLFRDQKLMQLEALRRLTAGHGLGQVVIDCAIRRVSAGAVDPGDAIKVVEDAISVWGARHARQMEEHYCRKSSVGRAENVRIRVEQAASLADPNGLARQLLKMGPASAPRTPSKQTGLDDGVRL